MSIKIQALSFAVHYVQIFSTRITCTLVKSAGIQENFMSIEDLYNIPAADITRDFYFNVGRDPGFMRWGIFIFALLAILYLAVTIIKRVKIWRMGRGELRTDYPEKRILAVIKYVFLHKKILQEPASGIMHAALFYGMIALFLCSLLVFIQIYFTDLFYQTRFIIGNFYCYFSLFADLFGLVVLFGLSIALYRRFKTRPSRLDTKPIDTFALILILIVIMTGYSVEGLRIVISGLPDFEIWSPVGYALAQPFSLLSTDVLEVTHYANWWIHMIAAFSFIGLVGTDKLGHIVISSLNVYYQNLNNESCDKKYRSPLLRPDGKMAATAGAGRAEDFSWKLLMDSDACMRCGRCQDSCPAWLTDKPLSPKKIQIAVKDAMDERIPGLLDPEKTSSRKSQKLVGDHVTEDELWSCTNCAACMESCPVQIEHVPKINEMRRYLTLREGRVPAKFQSVLNNMNNFSNAFGFSSASRGDWLPGELGIKTLAEDSNVEYLYYVGCVASYEERNQQVAIALIKVLQKAGCSVGILGPEEACCGDSAMRAGNEVLFHKLAARNLRTFSDYGVKKIITTCPHGYNIMKKEYPLFARIYNEAHGHQLSCEYQVYHHTEIIMDLINRGALTFSGNRGEKITYHDSCFLGRFNEIYTEPRDIIRSIPGTEFVEMNRHHKKSMCCGGGGGRVWIDDTTGTKINHFRTKEAQASGAHSIGTACPFCLSMITDGAIEMGIQNIRPYDLAELVIHAIEK